MTPNEFRVFIAIIAIGLIVCADLALFGDPIMAVVKAGFAPGNQVGW